MAVHRIRRGLEIPLAGAPQQVIHAGESVRHVALLGRDVRGLRARVSLAEGARVRRGQLLFEDRTRPGVRFLAPAAGHVVSVLRGRRRALLAVVIELSESERAGEVISSECAEFASFRPDLVRDGSADDVRGLLAESGLWTALRERPYGRIPALEARPHALFVTAIDTQPHAPEPEVVVREDRVAFQAGLHLVARLCEGPTFLCVRHESEIAQGIDAPVQVEEFRGPHPAGNAGVHIHRLAPVSRARTAWHIGYQDVMAIGRLSASGILPSDRVISIAGDPVARPRLVRTRLGASIQELAQGELRDRAASVRWISGSVLAGTEATANGLGFLGRYHLQVSALAAPSERQLLGWAAPGADRFSLLRVFASRLRRRRNFAMTSATHGSKRPILPMGTYERVLPMDILATYLLRALAVGDIERAEALGALELDEEDLALCSFVCPGKTDFGVFLRANLERIEKEG